MTSNLGSEFLLKGNTKKEQGEVLELLKRKFKPEFLNRIDEIVMFNSLNKKVVNQIIEKFLNEIKEKLAGKDIDFSYDKKAVDQINLDAFDEAYGARPIRRYIQNNVETPISICLLSNQNLNDFVLTATNNKLQFKNKEGKVIAIPEI